MNKKELLRAVKFLLFSISAGIVQIGTYSLMFYGFAWGHWVSYLISLVLSVVWNFTFNRKFTFQSSNNIPKAMCLVALFYAVFTPVTTLANAYLAGLGWHNLVLEAGSMILNFVTEYFYDRYVVFGDSVDSAVKA